jgi:hypothetical protein
MEKRVTTTIRLPEDLLMQARKIADREDRSLNKQLERWIREAVERDRRERGED